MILKMYIDNILIDKAEPDFRFADTIRKRDEVIEDLKYFLYKENFDKAFVAHQKPFFVLSIESKVGEILMNGINENDLKSELLNELQDEEEVNKILKKL
jgi:hypothetical protein